MSAASTDLPQLFTQSQFIQVTICFPHLPTENEDASCARSDNSDREAPLIQTTRVTWIL